METLGLFAIFFGLLVLGAPIIVCLGLSSAFYIFMAGVPMAVVPQKVFSGMDSFVLLTLPGFILAGGLMNGGDITRRIIDFSNSLFGNIRGGLGFANVGGSLIFGGISGTAVADTASIGSVMIPGMARNGYDKPFAAAVTAASSTIGPIIPPSLPMIIAGSLTGISIGRMFLAGAIPGLLLAAGMMLTCYLIALKKGYPRHGWVGFPKLFHDFKSALWAILLTFIILFGITGGVFTPTEASMVAVLYALVVGLFVYKGLTPRSIVELIFDAAKLSASLMLLIGVSNLFGWVLTSERIPQAIASYILSITENKFLILLILNVLLLIVGTFMETIAALVILFPTLLAIAVGVDVDPVHFGIIAVLNLMIGLTTPPMGICLFVASSISKVPVMEVVRAIIPFLICNLCVLLLVTYLPFLSLWLPNLIMGE
ncbi:MAG: TRAP transporter large permease [Salinicola sp.]|uniref:TRAP transporter large permease n=1 Tax=Salinicola sp. TaxID=1978524 RepID=UPI001D7250B3|nr:TRAP transporter large permease [Salinicola sp.]NRB54714.1 TRAP transporter large permease [Salinicola sp.]